MFAASEGILRGKDKKLVPEGSSDIREKHCLVNVTVPKFRSLEQDMTQAGKCLQRCSFNLDLLLFERHFILFLC